MKMSQVIQVLQAGVANNTDCEVDMQVTEQKVVPVNDTQQMRITRMTVTLYEVEEKSNANPPQS